MMVYLQVPYANRARYIPCILWHHMYAHCIAGMEACACVDMDVQPCTKAVDFIFQKKRADNLNITAQKF